MATEQEETLVECAGPAYGTSYSFRAETYGSLMVVSHDTLQPDWDVIAQLTSNTKKWLRNFHAFHVKGYQDDHTRFQDLDLPA
eukprot:2219776-Ditylum_brightwellii.AAC.1